MHKATSVVSTSCAVRMPYTYASVRTVPCGRDAAEEKAKETLFSAGVPPPLCRAAQLLSLHAPFG